MFLSEDEFVKWLRQRSRRPASGVALGIGDDAALVRVRPQHELILTTDLSIEGVHYLFRLHPPQSVGHRALARALSDVAAMGGIPRFGLVSLALKKGVPRAWVEQFYKGIRSLASKTGMHIVGGDTARGTGPSFADVVVAGEVPRGQALRRSGARPGDQIFVSGKLGLSALGLRLLKSSRAGASRKPRVPAKIGRGMKAAIRAHLYPEPRLALGRYLRENRLASALMDLSDGLSTDLARLCQASSVGAAVWATELPLPLRSGIPQPFAPDAWKLALNGGEDYELLFAVPAGKAKLIPRRFRGLPLVRIGEIRRSKSLLLILPNGTSQPLEPRGYDHFRR